MSLKKLIGALVFLSLLLPLYGLAQAEGDVVYLYSDGGDIPLYRAIANQTGAVLSKEPKGDIVVALDLNYPYLNDSEKLALVGLIESVEQGKTVILGLNTLRTINAIDPTLLKREGIYIEFENNGVLTIKSNNILKFSSFSYDSGVYGIARITVMGNARILLQADNIPIVMEVRVGRGRLILVSINPSDYYLRTKSESVAEFTVSLIDYAKNGKGIPVGIIALGIVGAMGAASALSSSSNSYLEKIKTYLKTLPLVFLGFQKSPEEILKNKLRRGIYEYIKAKGYTTINDVADTFSISRTNAKWHLSLLKRGGYIRETEVGNTIIFYPSGIPEKEAVKAFLLENRLRRDIYSLLKKRPMGVSDVARILGISKSTAHHHLLILESFGVIKRIEDNKFEVGELASAEVTR